jgi:hypothetical protein
MDKIMSFIKRPLIAGAIGLVIGLIIGLPILGWGLFPVQWTDASVKHLRVDLQKDYLRMAIDAYANNAGGGQPVADLAVARWKEIGSTAPDLLNELMMDPSVDPQKLVLFKNLVQSGTAVVVTTPVPGATALPGTTTEKPAKTGSAIIFVVLCLVLLVIGAALVYIFLLRKRFASSAESKPSAFQEAAEISKNAERTNYEAEGMEAPIVQFVKTYKIGDDHFDTSDSIESPTGEFLGECGVGISEPIGVGEPKKVTAFEVWLFDKNDIQTVTKVLMSENAYKDPQMRQKLQSKGEPVVLTPGARILLETATLQLEAHVVDMNYGEGALPAGSFFEHLTVELAVWPKVKA